MIRRPFVIDGLDRAYVRLGVLDAVLPNERVVDESSRFIAQSIHVKTRPEAFE